MRQNISHNFFVTAGRVRLEVVQAEGRQHHAEQSQNDKIFRVPGARHGLELKTFCNPSTVAFGRDHQRPLKYGWRWEFCRNSSFTLELQNEKNCQNSMWERSIQEMGGQTAHPQPAFKDYAGKPSVSRWVPVYSLGRHPSNKKQHTPKYEGLQMRSRKFLKYGMILKMMVTHGRRYFKPVFVPQ